MRIDGRNTLKILGINLCVFLVILLIADFFSFLFLAVLPRLSSLLHQSKKEFSIEADASVNSPAYQNKAYARILYHELDSLKIRYDPNVIWTLVPSTGSTVNIDQAGHRRTCYLPQPIKSKQPIQIFMFGGSTLFGTGSDDCNTIPSLLAKQLNAKSSSSLFQITNFGVTGHESTQELSWLIAELRKGARPDIVIFYDGINDVYASAYSPGIPGAHQNLNSITNRFESSPWLLVIKKSSLFELISYLTERIKRTSSGAKIESLDDKLTGTIATYRTNIEILDSLSKRYGFQYLAFWQPVLLASQKPLTVFEKSWIHTSGILRPVFQSAYKKLNDEEINFRDLSFYNLSHILDQTQDEVFVDYYHMTPKGNEIIAQAMASQIYPLLLKQSHQNKNSNELLP